MLQPREKKYILIMMTLLIVCIFVLVLSNSKSSKCNSEPFKQKANKVLVIIIGNFSSELDKLKKVHKNYDVIEFNTPLDISPENWNELAMGIFNTYNEYDAFVILHNPETITYTASALSFMLENLGKTVVLGSNGILAMNLAKNYNIPEVIISDGERIIRGCRAKRFKNAITSPNYPYLGKNEDKIELYNENILQKPDSPLKFLSVDPRKNILIFKVYPGVDSRHLMEATKVHGIILESYNSGYIPSDPQFRRVLADIIKNGVLVINVSQNSNNTTDRSLENIGVIYGGNITTEAALSKLHLILGNVEKPDHNLVNQLMKISMRGEI